MKKLLSVFAATLLFLCNGIMLYASAFDTVDNSVEIVTYNYVTGAETIMTMQEESSSISNVNSNGVMDGSDVSIAPAYFPELTQVEDEASPNSIIGTDNRTLVNPNTYPYSAVMYLYLGQDTTGNGVANSWSSGTGFMVGSKALVTAAHCYWSSQYGWVEECRTYKNQNSSTLGSTYYYPASWQCSTNYTNNLDYQYDWCVVTMQDSIGDQTGYFGYGKGGSMLNNAYTISGYPGDHNGFQYKASGTVSSETTYICQYNIDIMAGQSGAPIYDSDKIVWAINTYESDTFNQGNRITTTCYDLITAARNS